ncbi:hypothetical protein Tco_0145539, partial [Tanacetum coccineum]
MFHDSSSPPSNQSQPGADACP